jgi:predicted lysophospholipase L1 biosynthesis ABC-type transport system permease subunit
MRERKAGSRFLYEPFDAAAARLETHEQVTNERWNGLERRLGQIEATLERLERRLWLAVYGVVAIVLTRGVLSVLEMANK